MNRRIAPFFALLTMVALGSSPGADGVTYPSEPDPEPPPRKPPDPAREAEMLRDVVAPGADDPDHVYATRIRLARHQARKISDYLAEHEPAAPGLPQRRSELLGAACTWDDVLYDRRRKERAAARQRLDEAIAATAAKVDQQIEVSRQIFGSPKPTVARRLGSLVVETPIPQIRCPVKYCRAKPGNRCRGRRGTAIDTIHPERTRAFERQRSKS